MKVLRLVTILSTVALASPVLAQHPGMPGMAPGSGSATGSAAGSESVMSSMDRMSKDMAAVPMTGDADRDFVSMMIPHHQGAIDMARYELAHGKDPAMRRLAHEIVDAQRKEIAAMKQWLAKHPAH